MATAAAETIDRLLMLHIRRFGFRVVTYLESYCVFVASTANLLDMKDGIDDDSARARLALNLEVLRNASSTPSNARCVRIIEQLILGVEIKNSESHPQAIGRRIQSSSYYPHSAIGIEESQQHLHGRSYSQPAQQRPGNGASTNIEHGGYLPLYQQEHTPNGSTSQASMSANMNSEVERPLRWLSDNVGHNFEWMMTGTELPSDLNNTIFSEWNVNNNTGQARI